MPYAPVNGQELFFEDSGSSGFPLIMMHGFLMDQTLFDFQVLALAPKYRCIRFDTRAFGKTRWDEKSFSIYDTVDDCFGLMDVLGLPKAAIVGMSQGGYAALRMAFLRPERVAALVLMATQSEVNDPSFNAQCIEMRDTWQAHGAVDPILEWLGSALLGPKEQPGIKEHWDYWLPKWREHSGNAIFHAVNQLKDRDDIEHHLHEIKQPALLIHGEADFSIPLSFTEKLKAKLLNSEEIIVVPGAAHSANYTHAHLINQKLLDFLDKSTLDNGLTFDSNSLGI